MPDIEDEPENHHRFFGVCLLLQFRPKDRSKTGRIGQGGDVQAAKVLLDRICPPLKPQAMPVQIDKGKTPQETRQNVIDATLGGNIPPDVGSQLIKAIDEQTVKAAESTIDLIHQHSKSFASELAKKFNQRGQIQIVDAEIVEDQPFFEHDG